MLNFSLLQIYPPVVAGSNDKQRARAFPVIKLKDCSFLLLLNNRLLNLADVFQFMSVFPLRKTLHLILNLKGADSNQTKVVHLDF